MQKLHNSRYLLNSFLSQFPELVLRKGGDLSILCERVDLPIEAVIHKHKLIPFEKFISLLEVAADEFDYPEISFDLAAHQSIEAIGPIGVLLKDCKTFDSAIHKILDYLDVLTSGFKIELSSKGELLEIIFRVEMPDLFYRRQFQDYLLACTVSVIRNLMGGRYPIRGCYFARSELDMVQQKHYADFFGCPVAFESEPIRLVYSREILKAPTKPISQGGSDLMLGFKGKEDLQTQLEAVLPLYLVSGDTRLETIAKALGFSKGTFRRRLKEESVSFSDTLDSIRLSQANQYLESTYYNMNDIASLLGYSNQSAFTRSYLRWCGITPSDYRHNLRF